MSLTSGLFNSGLFSGMIFNGGLFQDSSSVSIVLLLFGSGEVGLLYDPSDFSTMFQDSAGTTPVTDVAQPVGKILDLSGNNNHAYQATAAYRPILRQDGGGYYYLEFDGVDDGLQTQSNISVGNNTYSIAAANITVAGGGSTMWPILSVSPCTATGSFGVYARNDIVRRVVGAMRAGSTSSFLTPNLENSYIHNQPSLFAAWHESGKLYAKTNLVTELSVTVTDTDLQTRPAYIGYAGAGTIGIPMRWYGGFYVRRVLSSADKAAAWAYLAGKAGVTL